MAVGVFVMLCALALAAKRQFNVIFVIEERSLNGRQVPVYAVKSDGSMPVAVAPPPKPVKKPEKEPKKLDYKLLFVFLYTLICVCVCVCERTVNFTVEINLCVTVHDK